MTNRKKNPADCCRLKFATKQRKWWYAMAFYVTEFFQA